MTGIPLVNSNSVNDINTSIIAIKKEMKSSGETEVNVNVNLPDTAIPVDEVTSSNMHSVTSNAVANARSYLTSEINTGKTWINGKPIYKRVWYKANGWDSYDIVDYIDNCDVIIDMKSIAVATDGTMVVEWNRDGNEAQTYSYLSNSRRVIAVTRTGIFVHKESWVIAEYTKTTD